MRRNQIRESSGLHSCRSFRSEIIINSLKETSNNFLASQYQTPIRCFKDTKARASSIITEDKNLQRKERSKLLLQNISQQREEDTHKIKETLSIKRKLEEKNINSIIDLAIKKSQFVDEINNFLTNVSIFDAHIRNGKYETWYNELFLPTAIRAFANRENTTIKKKIETLPSLNTKEYHDQYNENKIHSLLSYVIKNKSLDSINNINATGLKNDLQMELLLYNEMNKEIGKCKEEKEKKKKKESRIKWNPEPSKYKCRPTLPVTSWTGDILQVSPYSERRLCKRYVPQPLTSDIIGIADYPEEEKKEKERGKVLHGYVEDNIDFGALRYYN